MNNRRKAVITDRWYSIQYKDDKGKWQNSGIMEFDNKRECLREMTSVNYWGSVVRMVEHFAGFKPIGREKCFRK